MYNLGRFGVADKSMHHTIKDFYFFRGKKVGEKEYLYHGSPKKLDKLIPNQACDMGFKEGCQLAVYATSKKSMAICFAMGCIQNGKKDAERIMLPEYGDKIVFKNCHPNYGAKGYVYKLDKSKFVHAIGTQWVCYDEIIPDEIIEIDVDDYLDYCIVEER